MPLSNFRRCFRCPLQAPSNTLYASSSDGACVVRCKRSRFFCQVRIRYFIPYCRLHNNTYNFVRLSLGRRVVNLLPVAQRTIALTYSVVDRPWVVGHEFESHVRHENTSVKKSEFPHVKNVKNTSRSPKIGTTCW